MKNKKKKIEKSKNLYRIYNLDIDKYGEPFALCQKCFEKWEKEIRGKIVWYKIGENTSLFCNQCGK